MVSMYAMKGKKRKNREERHDIVQDAKRAITENTSNGEEEGKEVENGLEGIPVVPSDQNNTNKARVIFILEKASLEVAKVGKSYQLLNSDDHAYFLKKNNKNPADYRPDIVHQSGMVQAVYVKTEKGVLFEVKPYTRLPRTFKHFCGLMLQLLQKLSITAVGKRENLLRAIKNPVSRYLPVNSCKIGLSHSSEKLVNINNYVDSADSDVDLVFVVGAMAHGKIDRQDTDDLISSGVVSTFSCPPNAGLSAASFVGYRKIHCSVKFSRLFCL
uniref:Ribosomal RNA small subunit methyltransferase NEP1 n=1 Tax=Quercus lobata TaxID=97700 RepID=A0A7N2N9U1_QUELO